MIPHLCLCFLQLCNKSLINQASSGPYWENIGPRSFLYGPRCARSVLSRPRPIFSQYGHRAWLIRYTSRPHARSITHTRNVTQSANLFPRESDQKESILMKFSVVFLCHNHYAMLENMLQETHLWTLNNSCPLYVDTILICTSCFHSSLSEYVSCSGYCFLSAATSLLSVLVSLSSSRLRKLKRNIQQLTILRF